MHLSVRGIDHTGKNSNLVPSEAVIYDARQPHHGIGCSSAVYYMSEGWTSRPPLSLVPLVRIAPVSFFLNSSSVCCGFPSVAEGESVVYMRNGEAHPAIVMKVGRTTLKICKGGVGCFVPHR